MDRADVVALLDQMSGEGVAEGVARRRLRDAGTADRVLHRPLEDGFVEVMAASLAGEAVDVKAGGGKDPLPAPQTARVGVLVHLGPGQFDPASALSEVSLMLLPHAFNVGGPSGL